MNFCDNSIEITDNEFGETELARKEDHVFKCETECSGAKENSVDLNSMESSSQHVTETSERSEVLL